MKTFLKKVAPVLGALVLAVCICGIGEGYAAMISPTDNPSNVAGATNSEGSLRAIVLTIVNWVLGFLGLIAVLMVIYGGFLYVTSAGNDDNVTKGKNIVMYAVIGIIIILISFALVNTILGAADPGQQDAA